MANVWNTEGYRERALIANLKTDHRYRITNDESKRDLSSAVYVIVDGKRLQNKLREMGCR